MCRDSPEFPPAPCFLECPWFPSFLSPARSAFFCFAEPPHIFPIKVLYHLSVQESVTFLPNKKVYQKLSIPEASYLFLALAGKWLAPHPKRAGTLVSWPQSWQSTGSSERTVRARSEGGCRPRSQANKIKLPCAHHSEAVWEVDHLSLAISVPQTMDLDPTVSHDWTIPASASVDTEPSPQRRWGEDPAGMMNPLLAFVLLYWAVSIQWTRGALARQDIVDRVDKSNKDDFQENATFTGLISFIGTTQK